MLKKILDNLKTGNYRIVSREKYYRVIEIDKYAIASYNAIHNTNFEVQTYSFPCQDLSIVGKQKGMKKKGAK